MTTADLALPPRCPQASSLESAGHRNVSVTFSLEERSFFLTGIILNTTLTFVAKKSDQTSFFFQLSHSFHFNCRSEVSVIAKSWHPNLGFELVTLKNVDFATAVASEETHLAMSLAFSMRISTTMLFSSISEIIDSGRRVSEMQCTRFGLKTVERFRQPILLAGSADTRFKWRRRNLSTRAASRSIVEIVFRQTSTTFCLLRSSATVCSCDKKESTQSWRKC